MNVRLILINEKDFSFNGADSVPFSHFPHSDIVGHMTSRLTNKTARPLSRDGCGPIIWPEKLLLVVSLSRHVCNLHASILVRIVVVVVLLQ